MSHHPWPAGHIGAPFHNHHSKLAQLDSAGLLYGVKAKDTQAQWMAERIAIGRSVLDYRCTEPSLYGPATAWSKESMNLRQRIVERQDKRFR